MISFKGPAGGGKTELMTEAVTAIESLSGKRVMVLESLQHGCALNPYGLS